MAYTNKGNVQRFLNVDIASTFDTQIDNWVAVVAKWIDRYCKKTFEAAEDTRYYDGNGDNVLFIDDFVAGTIQHVKILDTDGSEVSSLTEGHGNDYLAYPRNETTQNELRMVPGASYTSFPRRTSSVEVKADFGYSAAVPADVELVATKLVAQIVKEGLKGGKVSSIQLGDYQANFFKVDEAADALGIYNVLDTYRDIEL